MVSMQIGKQAVRRCVDHSKVNSSRHVSCVQCAPCAGVKVVVTSPECFDPLAISDDCGVSASSALDEDTLPGNVIEEDETYWAPAIRSACRLIITAVTLCECDTSSVSLHCSDRTGPHWKHWIKFFLRLKFRLTRINILVPDEADIRLFRIMHLV